MVFKCEKKTYFASPEKVDDETLAREVKKVGESPVVSGLLTSIGGLLAILDSHRQIVALNDLFLKELGIDDPQTVLGLRPGEAVRCIHACDHPAGCGTTKYCQTCGAAIAIVTSQKQSEPVERLCSLTVLKDDIEYEKVFRVKAQAILVGGEQFTVLYLQDITVEQQRAALERTFYHDINNTLNMLGQASELMLLESSSEMAEVIHQCAKRLIREVQIQRCLTESDEGRFVPSLYPKRTDEIVRELETFFTTHPVARNKTVLFSPNVPKVSLETDFPLLLRILCNMIINALEASSVEDEVRFWIEEGAEYLDFCVWNREPIPEKVAIKIFERNFSTKSEDGRGIGTYSMKLFGEKYLGGKVTFSSSVEKGTTFRFSHPFMG